MFNNQIEDITNLLSECINELQRIKDPEHALEDLTKKLQKIQKVSKICIAIQRQQVEKVVKASN